MKKLLVTSILCTAILCGCSAKESGEISETTVPETSPVTVTTSSASVTKTETAAEKAAVTEPNEEEILLSPIPSEEPFEILYCKMSENAAFNCEDTLRQKDAVKRAREICFADGKVRRVIAEKDMPYISETAEDISFCCGLEYDLDCDGEYEYVISLQYCADDIGMGGAFVVYIDGDKYEILVNGSNPVTSDGVSVVSSANGSLCFLILTHTSGFSWYSSDVYGFESGMPEKALHYDGAGHITFENGVFYCDLKYSGSYPFILCGDGVFRQLGYEKISREDFEAHVKNGGAYLDRLAEEGDEVTDIFTYGHYKYELCGEDFRYDTYRVKNVFKTKRYNCSGLPEEVRFTDEVVYGSDVWAVQTTRSQDYDIGGGYVCYITDNDKTLHVVKDNIITDSIKLGASNFYPNWQIHFYDMDVPTCFALSVHGINYQTYFVIDGKITEMNWTLDGERLDTVDYTMLQCRGEGDGFVSYNIPIWDDDRFVKRSFTFADGDYTNIAGYSEEIDGEIIKWWDTDSGTSCETANEIMRKFCGFWDGAYRAETSYDGNERWLLLIEDEGFRTKAEMLDTLSEFCTPAAAEEVYSMLLENRYSDFEVIDGRIYLQDGPPNNYLPYYYVESAEEKDGVITARFYAYYSGQDIPYRILPPLYAEFVREGGVWKISSLPKEKPPTP